MQNKELERVERAADTELIKMVQGRYMFYLEEFAYDKIWEYLLANTHPDISVEIEEMGAFTGPERVKELMYGLNEMATIPRFGIMPVTTIASPLIVFSESGKKAKGYWHYFGGNSRIGVEYPSGEEELVAIWTAGKFANEFIEQNGEWKLLKVCQINWFRTPYDLGWIKQADCVRNIPPNGCIPNGYSRLATYRPDAVYTGHGPYNYGPHPEENGFSD